MKFQNITIAAAFVAMLSVGCTTDSYDSGDGNFSYLRADFALLRTNDATLVVGADTDEGQSLSFSNPFQSQWAGKADTVYRALVYYDAVKSLGEGHGDATDARVVKVRSVKNVPVARVSAVGDVADLTDSPIDVESVWMSTNGRYLNLALLLKAGKADGDDAAQTVALVNEGATTDGSGKRHVALRLVHDQGGVPQYYTVRQYVSVATEAFANADTLDIHVNSTKGEYVRRIALE